MSVQILDICSLCRGKKYGETARLSHPGAPQTTVFKWDVLYHIMVYLKT